MKFHDYIGIGIGEFQLRYIDTGLVDVAHHEKFPLSLYTYGRKAVHENVWDGVTSKCRGIIVNDITGEIVSRPFEKFHNYGSEQVADNDTFEFLMHRNVQPTIWEKMDGFLVTVYWWDGIPYAASKGSFHSIHAKWATAEIRRLSIHKCPKNHTLVFEGLHPDLRIVVDYGKRRKLVLLACVNNETGAELPPQKLDQLGVEIGVKIPRSWDMTLAEATSLSRAESTVGEEGYVATWYRPGATPFRLKIKFIDYLRLHRIITGVSPKRIWECLAEGRKDELNEYLNGTPAWFSAFAKKWVSVLTLKFDGIKRQATSIYKLADKRGAGTSWPSPSGRGTSQGV